MSEPHTAQGYRDTPTRTIAAAGASFAYRELGPRPGVPLVGLEGRPQQSLTSPIDSH